MRTERCFEILSALRLRWSSLPSPGHFVMLINYSASKIDLESSSLRLVRCLSLLFSCQMRLSSNTISITGTDLRVSLSNLQALQPCQVILVQVHRTSRGPPQYSIPSDSNCCYHRYLLASSQDIATIQGAGKPIVCLCLKWMFESSILTRSEIDLELSSPPRSFTTPSSDSSAGSRGRCKSAADKANLPRIFIQKHTLQDVTERPQWEHSLLRVKATLEISLCSRRSGSSGKWE